MTDYAAHVELGARDLDDAQLEQLRELLGEYHVAVGTSTYGMVSVQLTVPARSLRQAADLAVLIVTDAAGRAGLGDGEPVAIEVLQDDEFDRRLDSPHIPPLVSATQTAELLGISRQGVMKLGANGALGGMQVGNLWIFPRHVVEREAARRRGEEKAAII